MEEGGTGKGERRVREGEREIVERERERDALAPLPAMPSQVLLTLPNDVMSA